VPAPPAAQSATERVAGMFLKNRFDFNALKTRLAFKLDGAAECLRVSEDVLQPALTEDQFSALVDLALGGSPVLML
jgi:hypothetical protein